MAPGSYYDVNNPYRSVAGQTYARANANVVNAVTDPASERMKLQQAMQRKASGMGAGPMSNEERFTGPMPAAGFGSGSHQGYGQQQQPRNSTQTLAPPSAGGSGGGLSGLYGMNRVDPVTGMAAMPSAFDRLQYNKGLEQQGAFGAKAIGNQYLDAQASGNPQALAGAANNLNSFRDYRQYIQQNSGGPTPSFNGNRPMGQQPQVQQQNTGEDAWVTQGRGMPSYSPVPTPPPTAPLPTGPQLDEYGQIIHRASGGDANPAALTMVGEKGPEEFQGIDGFKQLLGMNGPEIGHFNEPGRVVPTDRLLNPRLRRMEHKPIGMNLSGVMHAAGGAYVPPPEYWSTPAGQVAQQFGIQPLPPEQAAVYHSPQPHLASKGAAHEEAENQPLNFQIPKPLGIPFLPSRSPINQSLANLGRRTTSGIDSALNFLTYPFVEPDDQGEMGGSPPVVVSAINNAPVSTPPSSPFAGPAWNPETDPRYAAIAPVSAAPAPAPLTLPSPLSQSMYEHGATELPTADPMARSFQVQLPERGFQGTASVSNAPRTKEATIEGLPASTWFANAARRQGMGNKYAAVPSDSAAPALNSRMMRNNRRTSIGLPMGA